MTKIHFNTAPNFYSGMNTKHIMRDVTIALGVVTAFSAGYYGYAYQLSYGLRVIGLMAVSVVTSIIVEIVWCLTVKHDKQVKDFLATSFPWVTAMILTLMCPVNITYYSLITGTIFAILIGKMVFGGFGQNIFNPAIVGRIFMMTCFGTITAADVITTATPTASMATTYGWLINDAASQAALLQPYGGLAGLFWGTYTGAMGETSALLMIILGAWLLWRKDIDWHAPTAFIVTVAVSAGIVALRYQTGLWYVIFHLLSGGLLFGAVFMITEPVTSPTSVAGQLLFGTGCGLLTIIIRLFGTMPEGVMYSILIMNMLTPLIDYLTAGAQDVMKRRNVDLTVGVFVGSLVIVGLTCGSLVPYSEKNDGFLNHNMPLKLSAKYSEYQPQIISQQIGDGVITYQVEVYGYAMLSTDGEYTVKQPNIVEVTLQADSGKVASVSFVRLSDNQYDGNKVENSRFLQQFTGLYLDGTVDAVSGATTTSAAVAAAVQAVQLDYAGGNH